MKKVFECTRLTDTVRFLIDHIVISEDKKKEILDLKDETLRKYVSKIDFEAMPIQFNPPVRKSVYKLFKNIKVTDLSEDGIYYLFDETKRNRLKHYFNTCNYIYNKDDIVITAYEMLKNIILNSDYTNPYIKKHTPKYNNEIKTLLTEAGFRCSYCKKSLFFDFPETNPLYEMYLLTSSNINSGNKLNVTANSINHKIILCPICKTKNTLKYIPSENDLIIEKGVLAFTSAKRIEEQVSTEKILINMEKIKEINDMYNSGDIKPLCESDFTEYYPKRIEEKLDDCDAILCERIKSDNAIFFQYYKQYLQQIFTYGDTNFDVIRNFIKEQYKSKEKIIDDYGEICYYLVESIRKALDLNVITSELLIAYFIQDCEVFK